MLSGAMQLGLGLGVGIAAAYAVTAPWLPLAFTDDADVAAAVWSLLPLVIGMLPLNALVYVLDGVLLGASDFKFLAGGPRLHPRLSLHSAHCCSLAHITTREASMAFRIRERIRWVCHAPAVHM